MASLHFADKLTDAIRQRGNSLCVGLDPRWDALPNEIRNQHTEVNLETVANAYETFCLEVLKVVAPLVPIVKPQIAFFEGCGPAGLLSLQRIIIRARELGVLVLLDSKRGDIASTAVAYAEAAFGGSTFGGTAHPVWNADAMTINPYLGKDAVEPFLEAAQKEGRGLFVLVRTSNKGAGLFQELRCEGKPLYQHVAEAVGKWSQDTVAESGFGIVGAVVGATHPQELASLRQLLPDVYFLIPGYGHQKGTGEDVAGGFREDGLGAIVNSARKIIASFDPDDSQWRDAVERATTEAIADLTANTPMGNISKP
ncbi:MAG: orotidine-5'-phosphate decarboxylase [Gemmataceae bacterium]